MKFQCGRYELDLSSPKIMGILNVTPDSFSDGGKYATTSLAIEHAHELISQGADILDIGGESTRPGATPVPLEEEINRVIPVIKALKSVGIPLSVDTYKPEVMRLAIEAGADMINDVCALTQPQALEVVAPSHVGICLMHMQGTPADMQHNPQYVDVVQEVRDFLKQRVACAQSAGISPSRILIDPGFGFGKKKIHNLSLLRELGRLNQDGYPILVGLSRKSVLGEVVGGAVNDRIYASVAASVLAVMNGANIVRVHDVGPTREALKVVEAFLQHEDK
jgi:dihydropteroate synthase